MYFKNDIFFAFLMSGMDLSFFLFNGDILMPWGLYLISSIQLLLIFMRNPSHNHIPPSIYSFNHCFILFLLVLNTLVLNIIYLNTLYNLNIFWKYATIYFL